ncbi:MAG: hypothetical protein A3E31_05985 [Candidatus Rokubacteria bacterium RIFCSPHIGHO2_12_FULL_73_22]|nr:MAG: hypothetical protein A3D33_09955 [Candidatus Rokubacteria bacterium RIFCSPHIGHO2_02_FULL_73_26]OGL02992.1 MAG: hypothetical protein A3E31_05985 [Candidatus Rokubacteria bacterium RIFCSPHIGHO2_12_FULL_73_22]OGL07547.1 MAG: hypothetical protein A3I14_01345 [Candidatus Rokubacteria bacterium RIFCSPLOWO2_02_FULL_73_56]OGL28141.1 MAG: hypothetical protein A3G44_06840 [Candidatus Rokubacteria bacterium RIFCSPLOWO2_12_FULL_73_47]
MRARALPLALVLLVLAAGAARAQNFGGARPEERLFSIQSETARTPSGDAVVRGFVENRGDAWVTRVVLLVEGLDAAGRVVGWAYVPVGGEIGPGARDWFDARAPALGATFRVRVHSFEYLPRGGG